MDTINHAFYINLDSRPDRKAHVERQLAIIGVKAQRFKAFRLPNGAVGCSMSHLKCIETARDHGWDQVMIVEDDISFLDPALFVKQLNGFLTNHPKFDMALLAGNNVPPYERIDDTCVKISRCQTTTGYIVQQHYYDTLIANIKEGIMKLISEPEKHILYAIDKFWFRLQEQDEWYLIVPLTVVQREDYSDIEKRPTNYTRVMTELDKYTFGKGVAKIHF